MNAHLPAPVASADWIAYFEANAQAIHPPEWAVGTGLSAADRFVIAPSIAIFQHGEEGSGRTIARFAWRYAERTADWDYPLALRALFDEEARHASDLGRFLDLARIPRVRADFSEGAFRFLRHRLGLDGALCVLLTAESIACIYYRALYNATGSPLLRDLCAQILRDETQHVRFQSQRLALLRRADPAPIAALRRAAHAALFIGATLLVARRHRRVLGAGLGARLFLSLCRIEWRVVDRMIRGDDAGRPTRRPAPAKRERERALPVG
jgi:hypothetical protein